jgi:hypothetical protein
VARILAVAISLALACATLAGPAAAIQGRYLGSSGHIRLSPPQVSASPVLDGVINEDEWSEAAVLDSFTLARPIEGVRDTHGTVCFVSYDATHLYVAFRAFDNPSHVQAPVVPRDQVWQGDWVGVSLDTYNDRQRSFFLCSNPIGIQMDGVDQEGMDSDMAPDFQYTSRGRLTEHGYEVEMAIPFKSLRFPNHNPVTFGFQAIRDIKRNGAHIYWAPVRRDINNYHSQIGSLQEIAGVKPGRNVEVNPTWTGKQLSLNETGDGLRAQDLDSRFGIGVKYGLTSNLIADVTVTPDFSQIEADAGVVDINERFAIFFEEKRPFFLEGSDIFTTPLSLVYTRRIADPRYGLKLTGKQGRTAIGLLHSADRLAGSSVPTLPDGANPYFDEDAYYTIARFRQDVFKNSNLGILAGERRQDDSWVRGASVDGQLRWADRYSFAFQGAQSWTRERDYAAAIAGLSPAEQAAVDPGIAALTGQEREGTAFSGSFRRQTRPLGIGLDVRGFSANFDADMGFVQRTDHLTASGWINPHIWGKEKDWFTGIHPNLYYERAFDYDGHQLLDDVVSLSNEFNLPRNTWFGGEFVIRNVNFAGEKFRDIRRGAVWAGSERYRTVRGGGLWVVGDQVVYAEAVPGHDRRWEIWSDLRFSPQIDGSVFLTGSSVWRNSNDSRFADVLITRVRLSYQFNRELALRWITELRHRRQWDGTDALVDEGRTLTPDVLLSYYLRPGTVVYLGYGSLLEGREAQDLRPQQASLFTKLSYLWQM